MFVSGCCSRFSSFHEAIARDPKGTTGALKATFWDQKATTWRPLGPTLGPLGVGRTLGGSLSLSLYIYIYIYIYKLPINRPSGRYVLKISTYRQMHTDAYGCPSDLYGSIWMPVGPIQMHTDAHRTHTDPYGCPSDRYGCIRMPVGPIRIHTADMFHSSCLTYVS